MNNEKFDEGTKRPMESGDVFVGIQPEVNYLTYADQLKLLRKCLPDEFDSVREGFCMKVKCRNCLLRKPGDGKMTYGECREYAKRLAMDGFGDEIDKLCEPPKNQDVSKELKRPDNDKKGLDPGTPKFWYSIGHVIDVARKGAKESKENSREYWTFCSIIGELVVLMGDERFDRYTLVEKQGDN